MSGQRLSALVFRDLGHIHGGKCHDNTFKYTITVYSYSCFAVFIGQRVGLFMKHPPSGIPQLLLPVFGKHSVFSIGKLLFFLVMRVKCPCPTVLRLPYFNTGVLSRHTQNPITKHPDSRVPTVQFSLPHNRFLPWADTSLRYFDTLFAHSICSGDGHTTRCRLYVLPNVSYSKIPN
jgi:hypothetical protein